MLILVHKFHVFQFGTFLSAYKSKQGGHEILEGYFDMTELTEPIFFANQMLPQCHDVW